MQEDAAETEKRSVDLYNSSVITLNAPSSLITEYSIIIGLEHEINIKERNIMYFMANHLYDLQIFL